MKNGIDTRYVSEIGSRLQHTLVCKLAEEAGYTTLRDLLSDFYKCQSTAVYKNNLPKISIAEAAKIINKLRAKELPRSRPKIKRLSDIPEEEWRK